MKDIKIALLICDTPADVIKNKHGDYDKLFKQLFAPYPHIHLTSYDVTKNVYPDIKRYGSRFSALDQDEWVLRLHDFIRSVDKTEQKVVGICFGHQVVAHALGGVVEKNPKGWEVGKTTLNIKGEMFQTKNKSVEMHQDHVVKLPVGFEELGFTEKSPNQIAIKKGKYFMVQGHPEYSCGFVEDLVKMRVEKGIFTTEFVGRNVVLGECDTEWFAEEIVHFLSQ